MEKKLLKSLLLIAGLFSSITASAYDFESGGFYFNIASEADKTVEVTYREFLKDTYGGNVVIPASVTNEAGTTYSVTSIGENSFNGCSNVLSVKIPNSVTSIGEAAFVFCSSLTSVEIPNSVMTIGNSAFYFCKHLISVEIPNSVETIGDFAFYNCIRLTNITIGNSVTVIPRSLFEGCTGLTSVTIPNSVDSIGEFAFNGCTSLTSIEIPNSVTSISKAAFNSCTSLTSVEIPNSVETIGVRAFSYCKKMESLTISSSVTEIDETAFASCTELKEIYNYSKQPQPITSDVFDLIDQSKCTLYVPTGYATKYRAAGVWKKFNIQEFTPDGVQAITGDEVKIAIVGNTIIINGTEEAAKVTVYGINGELVYSGAAKSITVPAHGVYIVCVAGVTKKVTL